MKLSRDFSVNTRLHIKWSNNVNRRLHWGDIVENTDFDREPLASSRYRVHPLRSVKLTVRAGYMKKY